MDALERRGHGASRSATWHLCRWPHFIFCLERIALRGWFQSLLQGSRPPARARLDLHPGPRLPWAIRKGFPRGQNFRRRNGQFPSGEVPSKTRPWSSELPAPKVDAGLLAVPYGFYGSWANQCDLPGTVQPILGGPWLQGHFRAARLGIPWRW